MMGGELVLLFLRLQGQIKNHVPGIGSHNAIQPPLEVEG